MYVKCDLEPVEFTPVTKFPEHAWCTVKLKDGIQLLIGICYHSINHKIFGSESHLMLRQLLSEVSQHHVIVMGDFNYPDIDWDAQVAYDSANADTKMFVDCVMDNFILSMSESQPEVLQCWTWSLRVSQI